jgi:hypothetical protein
MVETMQYAHISLTIGHPIVPQESLSIRAVPVFPVPVPIDIRPSPL